MLKPADDISFVVKALLIAVIVVIMAIDLALLARYGPSGTISVVVRRWGEDFPLLPYLIAFGMGAFLYHIAYR